jgi:hypothetical protein
MNLALKAKIGRCGRERHSVLAGTRFGYHFFLSHMLGQKTFSHAMVELVRSGMVKVFPFQVNSAAKTVGKISAKKCRGRSTLKMFSDASEFSYKVVGFTDGKIRICNPVHFCL